MMTQIDDIATSMAASHEGERLRALLTQAGKTPAEFARACDVSRTAVDRYLSSETIGRQAWLTVRAGLLKVGIDPRKIKPADTGAVEEEDLRPLVHGFDRDQLQRIRRMLEADPGPREKLLYFIDGLLFQHR